MWGVRCRVLGVGCRVLGVRCKVQGVGCRAWRWNLSFRNAGPPDEEESRYDPAESRVEAVARAGRWNHCLIERTGEKESE